MPNVWTYFGPDVGREKKTVWLWFWWDFSVLKAGIVMENTQLRWGGTLGNLDDLEFGITGRNLVFTRCQTY